MAAKKRFTLHVVSEGLKGLRIPGPVRSVMPHHNKKVYSRKGKSKWKPKSIDM